MTIGNIRTGMVCESLTFGGKRKVSEIRVVSAHVRRIHFVLKHANPGKKRLAFKTCIFASLVSGGEQ